MGNIELYLIRHGESEINTQPHLLSGRANLSELTYRGENQAKLLGKYLVGENLVPNSVFVSPALRAQQTAEIVLGTMADEMPTIFDVPTKIVKQIQERSMGRWEGKPAREMYTQKRIDKSIRLGKDFRPPSGESMNQVGNRMLRWSESLILDYLKPESNSIIFGFGHGGAIKHFASTIEGWTHEETRNTKMPHASISKFVYLGDKWCVEYVGRPTQSQNLENNLQS